MIEDSDNDDEGAPALASSGDKELPRCNVFVRNAADEFIATLEGREGPAWWPEALVVTDYSRDPAILRHAASVGSSSSNSSSSSSHQGGVVSAVMRCLAVGKNSKNLAGFLKYLRDRQKAGAATHNGAQYFLLPTSGAADDLGLVLLRRPLPVPLAQAAFPAAQGQAQGQPAGGALAPPSLLPGGRAPPVAARAAPAAAAAAGAAPAPVALRGLSAAAAAARSEIEQLRASTAAQLHAFVADGGAVRLAFPPLGERGNYVVVEEVAELPGLVSEPGI
jgi:hypothetical protein